MNSYEFKRIIVESALEKQMICKDCVLCMPNGYFSGFSSYLSNAGLVKSLNEVEISLSVY